MSYSDLEDLYNRFSYHSPANEETGKAHEAIRSMCLAIAEDLTMRLPHGREKSLAITKLEEAMFWANAAIARNQPKPESVA
jgi:hypothetical protein